jgi:hypothetical protein
VSSDYLQRYPSPYGTGIGDIWSAEESEIGRRIKNKHGGVLIHEVFKSDNGKPEERIYWVEENNPDPAMQKLIARARAGTPLWVEAQARRN